MIRWLFRVAVAIATAAIVTLVVVQVALEQPADVVSLNLLRGHAALCAQRIAETPPAERRIEASKLAAVLGYPVRLEPKRGQAEPRAERRGAAIHIVTHVPNTEGQLALGPIPFGHVSGLTSAVFLAALLAVAAVWFATRPLFKRIQAHEAVAAQLCAGDFSVRPPIEQGDALDGIGRSLGRLAERIEQLLSDERDLLRTVAHEVRAPIARMRFRVEKVQRKVSDELQKDATGLTADLQQVDSLFEELLTYVAFDEFDRDRPELQTESIRVAQAVTRVVDEVTAVEEAITIEIKGSTTAEVIANPKLFDRAVTNLLLNAMAYGGPAIFVWVREFAEEVVVDVQDSGPGIPEEDRPKVIKPFVRLAKKKTRGTGLGLAIVSRIMRLHGGRLHLLNAPSGGASVQLVWKNAHPTPKPRWRLRRLRPFGR